MYHSHIIGTPHFNYCSILTMSLLLFPAQVPFTAVLATVMISQYTEWCWVVSMVFAAEQLHQEEWHLRHTSHTQDSWITGCLRSRQTKYTKCFFYKTDKLEWGVKLALCPCYPLQGLSHRVCLTALEKYWKKTLVGFHMWYCATMGHM